MRQILYLFTRNSIIIPLIIFKYRYFYYYLYRRYYSTVLQYQFLNTKCIITNNKNLAKIKIEKDIKNVKKGIKYLYFAEKIEDNAIKKEMKLK